MTLERRACRTTAGLVGCLLAAVACAPVGPNHHAAAAEELRSEAVPASALVVLLPNGDATGAALRRVAALLGPVARSGEYLIVIRGRRVLLSTQAPSAPLTRPLRAMPVLPRRATTFQRRRYDQQEDDYRRDRTAGLAALQVTRQMQLDGWVGDVHRRLAGLIPGGDPSAATNGSVADAAVAVLRSLTGSGAGLQQRQVLLDLTGSLPGEAQPTSGPDLDGITVVVPDVPGTEAMQAAATERVLRRRAAGVQLLASGSDDQLVPAVQHGLDGRQLQPLAGDVRFDLGSALLPPSAEPDLQRILDLLTVRHPTAAAVLNGYTDHLGDPAGNDQLSVARAEAVRIWLIGHGVAADRLTISGHGEQDPVLSTGAQAQPASRRVVVVLYASG